MDMKYITDRISFITNKIDYGYNVTKVININGIDYVHKHIPLENAKVEVLADNIYKICNINAPDSFYDNTGRYSVLIEGESLSDVKDMSIYTSTINDGFLLDCLLDNYDSIGIGNIPYSNIVIDNFGKAWRVDNGSALIFTGTGRRKAYTNNILETIHTYRTEDGGRNYHRFRFFSKVTDIDIKKQLESIIKNKDSIINIIKDFGYNEEAETTLARINILVNEYT